MLAFKQFICKLLNHNWLVENTIIKHKSENLCIVISTHYCIRCGEQYIEYHIVNANGNVRSK